MSSCEKCWSDAHRCEQLNIAEEYHRLLDERRGANACTAEQQAGPDAKPCPDCDGRMVLHQITGQCMVNAMHSDNNNQRDQSQKHAEKLAIKLGVLQHEKAVRK